MAKPMSPMCLIAIGLLLSFADVSGETLKSTPGVGQTADDARKGSEEKGEDDVGNGALKETPETLMAQLGNLKDAGISGLRLFMKVLGDLERALDFVLKVYPHVSASYESWQNGEISLREFQWEVGRDVVRVGSPIAGTFAGPALGQLAIPIPGLGAFVGGYVGGKVGAMFGELVTG